MTAPFAAYSALAGQTDFVVPFPYLEKSHVKVTVNGVLQTVTGWPQAATLRLPAQQGGSFIEIYRETPLDGPLVDFQDGAVLTSEDLNKAVRQLLFRMQEDSAFYDRTLKRAQTRLAEAGGIAVPVDDLTSTLAGLISQDAVLDEFTAKAVDVDTVAEGLITTTLDGLERDTSVRAKVRQESIARATEDGALAAQITEVSTEVGDLYATVGILAESVDGVNARFGVSLDVNGYVTGFVQNNDGQFGDFSILADRFRVVAPGAAALTPFEVSGGVVRIKEAVIGTLTVNKLQSGTMTADVELDGSISVGSGKIVWDNGSVMKVSGVGFGTSNQFIEWVGPSMAVNLCSEATAIQYLKMNGDAYFGGSLTAGVLKNAATTTATGPSASVEIGPFGSNGDPRVITFSYSFADFTSITDTAAYSGTVGAVIALEKWNGTAWSSLTTITLTGSIDAENGAGVSEPGFIQQTMGGSGSFTDNSGGTSGIQYRVRLVSRNTLTITSTVTGTPQRTQSISAVSIEE